MDSGKERDTYSDHGHFLYADYSPLDDDRNVIEMLKAFVSLTSGLIRLHTGRERMSSVLDDSDSLRNEILSAIKEIRSHTTSSIENYRERNSEALATELREDSSTLLKETQSTLITLLNDTEVNFADRHQKYKENIAGKIKENDDRAVALVQEWLSKDYLNLPRPVLSNLTSTVVASLGPSGSLEQYSIQRVASSALSKAEEREETNALRFSYTTRIEAKDLEFWNYKRKISELGIRELMLPAGLKASISEKFKQTFKFGQKGEPAREPDFRKVDDYYVVHAELQGHKSLLVQVAADVGLLDNNLFTITYAVDSLSEPHAHSSSSRTQPSELRPKIDYRATDNGQISEITDLLQMGEIERMSDLPKIRLLGTAILSKMGILTDHATIASRGQLESLSTDDAEIIKSARTQKVDFVRLFEFLGLVASIFRPTLNKLREKTPMKDEIILRQELPGGQRKEFTIRLEDLRSQLGDEKYGKPVLTTLGL